MNDIDRKILRHLVEDGHMTNARLAKSIGLSESATLERVRRLEAAGVVQGYTVLVDPARVDRGLEVIVTFTLQNQNVQDIQRFIDAMLAMEEVLSCAQVLGRFDFVAHVAVKDPQALERLINDKLIGLAVINRMESLTVLKMVKRFRPPVPLDGG